MSKRLVGLLSDAGGRNAAGFAAALIVAGAASVVGRLAPLIGAPISGIVLGAIIANTVRSTARLRPGVAFTARRVLQASIILLGASLQLSEVFSTGRASFLIMLSTLGAAFLAALVIGRALRVPGRLMLLIAAGTGICGGSAIASLSPIIDAEESEITYAMSTIFAFNLIAVLVFPIVGHLFHFTDRFFGTWAGTAINDTSSVVAAGYAYSRSAGDYATIVKLTRTTMIIPVSIIAAVLVALRRPAAPAVLPAHDSGSDVPQPTVRGRRGALVARFPWFIIGFLATSCVETTRLVPQHMMNGASAIGRFLIVVALAAVGLNADFRRIAHTGVRPLLLGLSVWGVVALSSVALQKLLG